MTKTKQNDGMITLQATSVKDLRELLCDDRPVLVFPPPLHDSVVPYDRFVSDEVLSRGMTKYTDYTSGHPQKGFDYDVMIRLYDGTINQRDLLAMSMVKTVVIPFIEVDRLVAFHGSDTLRHQVAGLKDAVKGSSASKIAARYGWLSVNEQFKWVLDYATQLKGAASRAGIKQLRIIIADVSGTIIIK